MVIRMYNGVISLLTAKQLYCTVCYNFVRIHIDGSSCATLYRIYYKVLPVISEYYLIAGYYYCSCYIVIKESYLVVSHSSSLFDKGKASYELRMHLKSCYVKILCSPKGLHPVVSILRYFLFSN